MSLGTPSAAELRVKWRRFIAHQKIRESYLDRFVLLNRKCGISLKEFREMSFEETEALLISSTNLDEKIKEEINKQRSLNDLLDRYSSSGKSSSATFSETIQNSPFNSIMNRIKTNPLSIIQ